MEAFVYISQLEVTKLNKPGTAQGGAVIRVSTQATQHATADTESRAH